MIWLYSRIWWPNTLDVEALEEVRQPDVERRAEHRPPERVDAADDEHHEDPEAELDAELGGLREPVPVDEERHRRTRRSHEPEHEHRDAGSRSVGTPSVLATVGWSRIAIASRFTGERAIQMPISMHDRERTEVHPEQVPLVGRRALAPSTSRSSRRGRCGFTSCELGTVEPVNWFHCVMTSLMISLSARVAMARKNRFASTCDVREGERDRRAATAMPNATATMPVDALTGRPRRRVAADHRERGLRERELPREPEHEVEADDDDGVDDPQVEE